MAAQVVFRVDDQQYALPIDGVAEIIPLIAVSHVPNLPPEWYGMANIRGVVTPILDLRAHFQRPIVMPDLAAPIIILREAGRQLGLLVDEVEKIIYQDGKTAIELHEGQLIVVLEPRALFDKMPDHGERRN